LAYEVNAKMIKWKKANPEKKDVRGTLRAAQEARWVECGVGPLRISGVGSSRWLVMRTKIGRVILNCYLYPGVKIERSGESGIQMALLNSADGSAEGLTL
jgi:hypothetical protein